MTVARSVRWLLGLLTADGQLLPGTVFTFSSRIWPDHATVVQRSALQWLSLLIYFIVDVLFWLVARVFLLVVGGLHFGSAPPRLGRGKARIAYGASSIAALFLGLCVATFHVEYMQPYSADAALQFLYDTQRLAIAPSGLAEIPLPRPLARPLDEPPRPHRVHHMTVATRFEENLYRLLRSAMWHGDNVDVFGRNDPGLQTWGDGFGLKLKSMLDYCDSLPPDDIMLFTDAYDVIMMGGHEAALAGYNRVIADAPPETDPARAGRTPEIVFTAETNCAPDPERAMDYPPSDREHLFAFLNSGLFMARVGAFSRLLRAAPPMDVHDNDQRFFTTLYLNSTRQGGMPRIVLDHGAHIFLTMTHRDVAKDVVYRPVDRSWRHAVTGNAPAIIHYPGWIWTKQHVQSWHLVQGVNNNHCGLFACFPQYAGWTLVLALGMGVLVGIAWDHLMQACKLGRAIASFSSGAG